MTVREYTALPGRNGSAPLFDRERLGDLRYDVDNVRVTGRTGSYKQSAVYTWKDSGNHWSERGTQIENPWVTLIFRGLV